tara:strand:+ start:713 stop:1048 length:336 start_codon:yes stop_codon:yes gene_type:complete
MNDGWRSSLRRFDGIVRMDLTMQLLVVTRRGLVAICALMWLLAASAVIAGLHASLLTMMKDADALGFGGRRGYMKPVIAWSYNLTLIAVLVNGKNWRKFDDRQKGQLIGAL